MGDGRCFGFVLFLLAQGLWHECREFQLSKAAVGLV